MTRDEFKGRMLLIKEQYEDDPEVLHIKADELLCQALTKLGYHDGVKVFQSFTRWYA